jgi:16S rRNA (guanine1207-N2)-methyltransferase
MSRERLTLALDAGWLPAEGRVLGLGTRLEDLPPDFPVERLVAVQDFRPEAEALERAGIATAAAPEGDFAAALVHAARARDLSRDRLARARAAVGPGPLVVDGAKTDGIESLLSAVRKRAGVEGVLSKAHGKVFRVPGDDFGDWICTPAANADGFVTAPGIFSADGIDRGSALLADALPEAMSGAAADFGAGWGYLSHRLLERGGITECHLVEADRRALDCARRNVADVRARFAWADVSAWAAPEPLDHVLCNPPFHVSRRADPDIGRAFLAAAARNLAPRGRLWLVANRQLPYEGDLSALFGQVTELGGDAGFKVILAERPRRKRA